MTYTLILLVFGLIPLGVLWGIRPGLVRRHLGSLGAIVLLILMVSIPWELISVNRIWYYSPGVLLGSRFLNLPIEELAFFIIYGLLAGTAALWLGERKKP